MHKKELFIFHVHTNRSVDCLMSIKTVVKFCKKRGIRCVAICDHNYLMPADKRMAFEKEKDLRIIPAVEYSTNCGDIIALGLDEFIASRDCTTVINTIKEKGGIVVLPHPMRGHRLEQIPMKEIDMVEVFNARCSESENNGAVELAARYGKVGIAGCDAHFPWELGLALNEIQIDTEHDLSLESILNTIKIVHRKNGFPKVNSFLSQVIKSLRTKIR